MSLETYTVNGLSVDMLAVIQQQVLDSGSNGASARALDARITSANTLEICWINFGNGNATVTPAGSQSISVICF